MTDTGGASEDGLTVFLNCGHCSEAPHLDRTGVTINCEGREGGEGREDERRERRKEREDGWRGGRKGK